QISTDYGRLSDDLVKVPAGKGIIGHVVETGETVIVNDAYKDERHYSLVDQNSGITTRSLLAVPLHTRKLDLGIKRGAFEARIIGGLEAINKSDGGFDDDDVKILQTLANQAATTLEIAHLYSESNEVFLSGIKALTAAIDAKDKYTVGHSLRVSDFSVEIALELGLSTEEIYHLRIGTLLHDVGKIGISDVILGKPGRLTTLEYDRIKEHPSIGERILGEIRLLQREIKAVAEHHERLDGSGYPRGLCENQISIYGKIVAVADVFDAMTSERPYRKALAVEDVFSHLQKGIGEEFDPGCVENLILSYSKGNIRTQLEREGVS
ncbi:MAG: HD domain-containing protein, partial [Anaerolineaceae bacterium]|nr:HD domain-containing protein [Anaerolineaceae bacterium]